MEQDCYWNLKTPCIMLPNCNHPGRLTVALDCEMAGMQHEYHDMGNMASDCILSATNSTGVHWATVFRGLCSMCFYHISIQFLILFLLFFSRSSVHLMSACPWEKRHQKYQSRDPKPGHPPRERGCTVAGYHVPLASPRLFRAQPTPQRRLRSVFFSTAGTPAFLLVLRARAEATRTPSTAAETRVVATVS